MTTKMQDVVLEQMEKVIKDAGLSPVVQMNYANSGLLYGLQKNGISGVIVKFSFQTDRVNVDIGMDPDRLVTGYSDCRSFSAGYGTKKIGDMLRAIREVAKS